MALGAVAAVEAAGLLDQITIAGFDGSPDAVQAIKDGKLLATGLQPAVLSSSWPSSRPTSSSAPASCGAEEKQSIDCVLITPTTPTSTRCSHSRSPETAPPQLN